MLTEQRLALLRERHAQLGQQVEAEEGRRCPDPMRLTALKKRKLALKDEIAGAERGSTPLTH